MKIAARITIAVLGFLAIAFILQYLLLGNYAFFGPKKENIRRKVFEETQSYVEGKRQDAIRYYKEYMKADESEQATILELVSMSFANFDETKLNPKLKAFVEIAKYGKNGK